MDNIFFDNDIQVVVSQNPKNPIVGDDVVFTAKATIANFTQDDTEDPTYFFSYTWLESKDGGNTFYQIGPDLDTLTLNNVSNSFFTSIYKIKVAIIDLANIILTEDGNNLTTQFGEILIGSNSTGQLSVQAASNDSITPIVQSAGETDIIALNTSNLNTIINEASVFDTTINDDTKAEVYSGQINLDKNINNNTTIIPVEQLPDPDIETVLEPMSISIQGSACQQKRNFPTDMVNVACAATSYYKDCPPCDKQICVTPYAGQMSPIQSKNSKVTGDGLFSAATYHCCNTRLLGQLDCRVCNGAKVPCVGNDYTPIGSCEHGSANHYEIDDDNPTDASDEVLDGKCKCGPPRDEHQWQAEEVKDYNGNVSGYRIAWGFTGALGGASFLGAQMIYATWAGVAILSLPVSIAVVAGATIALAAGAHIALNIHYAITDRDGKAIKRATCKSVYQEYTYNFSGTNVKLTRNGQFPTQQVDTVPPPSYSNCKCGVNYSENGDISLAQDAGDACVYNVTSICGPVGASCYCDLDNPGNYGPDVPPKIFYTMPDKPPNNLLFKGSNTYGDCVGADGLCQSSCVGMNCCGSGSMEVYELGPASTGLSSCDQDVTMGSVTINKCPDSNKPRDIIVINITARLRTCGETYGSGKYKTQSEAVNAAKVIIGKKTGIIFKQKLERDAGSNQSIGTLGNETLFVGAKAVDDIPEAVNNNCDLCKPAYRVSPGGSVDYQCDDSSSLPCGYNAGCKIPDSNSSTPVSIITITKIDNPTPMDLADNNVKTSVGEAIALAQSMVSSGTAALIVSDPCP